MAVASADTAKQTIDQSVRGFYFIAGTQAVLALFVTASILADAALIAALAYWLHRSQRALPATLLLVFAAANTVITVTNTLGVTKVGGRSAGSLVVAALLVWLGVRALIATRTVARTTGTGHEEAARSAG